MKNKLLIVLFVIMFFALAIFLDEADVNVDGCFSDITIENYEATYTFNDKGDALVSEVYTYNYSGDYHAKYRDIDVNKFNAQNPIDQNRNDVASLADKYGNTSFDITSLVTVEVNGKVYPNKAISENHYYQSNYAYVGITGEFDEMGNVIGCDPYSRTCESIFVYLPDGFGSQTVFTYTYTIKGALTLYNDVASFNWNIFKYNESDVQNGKVKFVFPEQSKKEDLRVWARGAHKDGVLDITSDNTIEITFDRVKKDVALEVRVLSSVLLYPNVRSENKVNSDVLEDIIAFEVKQSEIDNMRITLSQILYCGAFALLVVMIVCVIYVYNRYDKEFKPEFDKEYLRELPNENITPAEMSYLYYFGSINDEDCTATLLDLVRRGYLVLDENGSGINDKDPNFEIRIVEGCDCSSLKSHEKFLIDWFIGEVGDGKCVTIKQIEDYPKKESRANKFMQSSSNFVKKCKEEGKKHHYIENATDKTPAFIFALIPFIYFILSVYLSEIFNLDATLAIFVSLVTFVAYLIYVATIKKRTKLGAEEFAKWKAFKAFLNDFSQMEDYPMPGVIIWEKYLVYATSLKMADKVMEQLKVKLPNVDEVEVNDGSWFYDDNATFMRRFYLRRRYGFYFTRINSSYKTAKMTGFQTIAQAQAKRSSGSGRGGGFSGGSSFGGGGGGGRSR